MIAARLMQAFGLFLVQGQSQEGGGRQTPFALESPDGGHGGDYILFRQASVEDNQGGRGVGIQGRRFFRVAGLPYFLPLIFEKKCQHLPGQRPGRSQNNQARIRVAAFASAADGDGGHGPWSLTVVGQSHARQAEGDFHAVGRAVHKQIASVVGGQFPCLGQGQAAASQGRRAAPGIGHRELQMAGVGAHVGAAHAQADRAPIGGAGRVFQQHGQHEAQSFPVAFIQAAQVGGDVPGQTEFAFLQSIAHISEHAPDQLEQIKNLPFAVGRAPAPSKTGRSPGWTFRGRRPPGCRHVALPDGRLGR